jgi:nucleoside-triphosphatase THEP1
VRGGLERWKRGEASGGVRQAVAYALDGVCDASAPYAGVNAAASYSGVDGTTVTRYSVTEGDVEIDELDPAGLARWIDGADPRTGEARGRELSRPEADLLLDATMNTPKSMSLAVLIVPGLRADLEQLQDRVRDRTLRIWQRELNARRGAGGRIREGIARLEVVELRHERSRALDPHVHRHLWLNVKVLGHDGRWSNVDSRVAMRLHTVINAEGDLAARTDPEWVAALARHGLTLDAAGEIAELAHLVRPLSRRSNQIEANRRYQMSLWRRAHPGRRPDPSTVARIDRAAWARARPGKPEGFDESAWEDTVRSEIVALDPEAMRIRAAGVLRMGSIGALDRDLLGARAITDADHRSVATGGRFSVFDIRAGALRALAASGVVAERELIEEIVEDITARAAERHVIDFLPDGGSVPHHVKHLMARSTAQAKVDLGTRFDDLGRVDENVSPQRVNAEGAGTWLGLDAGQTAAAQAVAGRDRLVTVTGPAGSGKTTLLLVARRRLAEQQRRMLVVAPTKKAATVAGREIGTAASSLHALLVDHGYRFGEDRGGSPLWTRHEVGEVDPSTGAVFRGPRRFPIRDDDRIVVDEAGMVDLHTAIALAELAGRTGAGIAMIGDPLQARPVGHSGAMAIMQRRARNVVLDEVHRFRDPDYAALTLRLRDPADFDDASAVARALLDRASVELVADAAAARERMVAAWLGHHSRGERVALVVGSNVEAQQVNDRIQQERIDRGELDPARWLSAQYGQVVLVGDVVQTRRNDAGSQVENRATWIVTGISRQHVELAAVRDIADRRRITHGYAAEHVHLAYASTVHGIQGETVHTCYVGPDVDASGLYVGMTRGRQHNVALVRAPTVPAAVESLADTAMRGRSEVTLEDAQSAARQELDRAARDATASTPRADLQHSLRALDAELAAAHANGHGRGAAGDVTRLAAARVELVRHLDGIERADRQVSRPLSDADQVPAVTTELRSGGPSI